MMRRTWFLRLVAVAVIPALLLVGCQGAGATPSEVSPATEVPAVLPETEAPSEPAAAEAPTELRVAAVLTATIENAWERTFLESFSRVQAEKPHGLDIKDIVYTESVWGDEALVTMRQYAATGQYDIIWANSAYSDQVKILMDEFPDIMFVYVGAGAEALGRNAYWYFNHIHECGYLEGILAGSLTKTDKLGVVGWFPSDDTNDVINAYIAGARSVNPAVTAKVTYIESWYDPPKAMEAAYAQIAAGVDQLLMMGESFEPCTEKGIMCYATYMDYNFAAPESIVTSAEMYWDPGIKWIVDEWWNHKTTGAPYAAPMEPVWFHMSEGVCDLSPYHGLESQIPQGVKDAVANARQGILDGTLKVELNVETPKSE